MCTVRVSAKELTSLILDEERLRAERADRKSWKSRVTGLDDYGMGGHGNEATRPRQPRRQRPDEEDLEYKLAIEASKNEMEEERRRRDRAQQRTDDDDDLQKAIRLSQEEEELRRRELEETNANSLFDDTPAQPAATQPTGWNQGYQQQGAVDWFGNLVDQQQPQNTGFLNTAYSQPTGMQPQQTGFQNGYGGYNGFQQPQPTGYDQFGQQQNYLQPQQTAYNMGNNPWGQQSNGFGQQQQQQQQPLEQQNTLQPGSNNPWASPSGAHTTDSIKPMQTGSNNPFAAITRPATAQPVRSTAPSLGTLQEQQTSQFNDNNSSAFNPIRDFSAPSQSFPAQTPQQQDKPMDPHAARLNALLASGEGQDTFGNVGNLRIPAQHTAPGTFVNSAGQGAARLTANATGNNPFLNSQFTGMPQQTGFANQNRMMPAQTGPVNGFGGNPFGASYGGQQQQQQQQGSLIDL